MSIGQRLRSAREAKGLSVEDIVQRTYIQSKFLHAIDREEIEALPSSHRKFFLRAYAEAVGIDPDEILAELPEYEPPPPAAPAAEGSFDGVEDGSAGERKGGSYRDRLPRLPHKRGVPLSGSNAARWLIGLAIALLAVIGLWYFVLRESGDATRSGPQTADSAGSPTEIIARPGEQPTGDSAAAYREAGDSLTLKGRAIAQVWYSILMDNKRSETGLLDSGDVKEWRASETFKITLGNAGGLVFTLGDSTLGTLGPMAMTVRNQVITEKGLE